MECPKCKSPFFDYNTSTEYFVCRERNCLYVDYTKDKNFRNELERIKLFKQKYRI